MNTNLIIRYRLLCKKEFIKDEDDETTNTVSLSKVCQTSMSKFGKTLEKLKKGTIYELKLTKLEFNVKADRLVLRGNAPVGIINALYEALFLCKIRHKEALKECCTSSVLGRNYPTKKKVTWFRCCYSFMKLILALIFSMPWVARIIIYYTFEDEDNRIRKEHAREHGMVEPYTGNLLTFLTPLHIMFVLCYVILTVDGILLGILSSHVSRTLKMIIRKCFRDMHHRSRSRAFGWCVRLMIKPFSKCGIFGLIFACFYWIIITPFTLVIMAFYLLPSLNIAIRLIIHFVAYSIPYKERKQKSPSLLHNQAEKDNSKQVKKSRLYKFMDIGTLLKKESLERPKSITMRYRILQLVVIGMCLVSILSFAVLAMECIVFFVEYVIFSAIGIILNARFALKYVSVFFMIALYARDCFGSVTKQYDEFNAEIHKLAVDRIKKQMSPISKLSYEEQNNTAFVLPDTEANTNIVKTPMLEIKEGVPKWRLKQMIVFLDRDDTTYITQKFFFDTVEMPHSGGPGNLLSNLLSAICQFMVIVVFLLFVVLIVMIFGDEYNVSGFNQMIATLVTGFLPWVFRNILFKSQGGFSLDTENVNFQASLSSVIKTYEQSWPIADIEVDSCDPVEDNVETTETINNGHSGEQHVDNRSCVDMVINMARDMNINLKVEMDDNDKWTHRESIV